MSDNEWEDAEDAGALGQSIIFDDAQGDDDESTIVVPLGASARGGGAGSEKGGGTSHPADSSTKRARAPPKDADARAYDVLFLRAQFLAHVARHTFAARVVRMPKLAAQLRALVPSKFFDAPVGATRGAATIDWIVDMIRFITFKCPLTFDASVLGVRAEVVAQRRLALAACEENNWGGKGANAGDGRAKCSDSGGCWHDDVRLPVLLGILSSETRQHPLGPTQLAVVFASAVHASGIGVRLVQSYGLVPAPARAATVFHTRPSPAGTASDVSAANDVIIIGESEDEVIDCVRSDCREERSSEGAERVRKRARAAPPVSNPLPTCGGAHRAALVEITPAEAVKFVGVATWVEVWCVKADGGSPTWVDVDLVRQWVDKADTIAALYPKSMPRPFVFAVSPATGAVRDVTLRYTTPAGFAAVDAARALVGLGAPAYTAPSEAVHAARSAKRADKKAHGSVPASVIRPPPPQLKPSVSPGAPIRLRRLRDSLPLESETWAEHTIRSAERLEALFIERDERKYGRVGGAGTPPAGSGVGAGAGAGAGSGSGSRGLIDAKGGNFDERSALDADESALGKLSAAASSTMPTRANDFKGHPIFALESMLGSYETIYPRTGQIGTFKGLPVWPRASIVSLQTRSQWLRKEGRDVVGPPVKTLSHEKAHSKSAKLAVMDVPSFDFKAGGRHAAAGGLARAAASARADEGDSASEVWDGGAGAGAGAGAGVALRDNEEGGILLWGRWQTVPHVPPTIGPNDPLPVSRWGTFEFFHDSMLPRGCAIVNVPRAKAIATKLHIDAVEVVTGFDSQNGRRVPVKGGVLVRAHDEATVRDAAEEVASATAEKASAKHVSAVNQKWERLIRGISQLRRLQVESRGGDAGTCAADDEPVVTAFRLFTRTSRGIEISDLRSVAHEISEQVTDRELVEMLEEADCDGDGAVSLDEFRSVYQRMKGTYAKGASRKRERE